MFTVYAPLLLLARRTSGEIAEAPASALLPPTGQDGFKDSRSVDLLVYVKVNTIAEIKHNKKSDIPVMVHSVKERSKTNLNVKKNYEK